MEAVKKNSPLGWEPTELKKVVFLRNEKVDPRNVKGQPYISLEHIASGSNRIIKHGYSEDVKSTKSVFYAGDILYGKLRPYLNKVCQPNFDGICSTDILVYAPSQAIDNKFLLHFLSKKETAEYATRRSKGINLPRVSAEELGKIKINLPPINEQKRIVSKINELQSRSQKAQEALESVPDLLEQLRQSILASAFRGDLTKKWREQNPEVESASELLKRIRAERRKRWEEAELEKLKAKGLAGKKLEAEFEKQRKKYKAPAPLDTTDLPELPQGWCVVSIDMIAFVTKLAGFEYTKYVKYDPNGDLAVIKAENAGKYGFKATNFSWVKSDTVNHLTRSRLKSGDLLMVFVGAGVGQVAMVPDDQEYFLGPNISMIRVLSKYVLPEFIEYFLRSQIGFFLTMSFTKAVAQPSLSMGAIRQIPLFIPPVDEQLQILEKIKRYFQFIEKVEKETENFFILVSNIENAILSKAFRGELVPQDDKDEPASILLDRIKAEKAALTNNPKRKASKRVAKCNTQ